MECVPNWYRWLLIAGATLIMCACRAPLIAPGFADLPLAGPAESKPPIDSTDAVSTQDHETGAGRKVVSSRDNSSTSTRTSRAARALQRVRKAIGRDDNLDTSKSDSFSAKAPDPKGLAPVVRQSGSGIEVQRIDGQLTANAEVSASTGRWEHLDAIRSRFQSTDVERPRPSLLAQKLNGTWATSDHDDAKSVIDGRSAECPQGNNTLAPIKNSTTTFVDVFDGEVDEETASPFEDDPAPVVEDPVVEDPVAEYEHEEAIGEAFIHDGMIDPLGVRQPWRDYPDEYIFDGGDANYAVDVRNDWSLRNLDPEDTVGHFDTLDGRVVVQPSNRVRIYAPRFAATRKVTAAHENEMRLQPITAEAPVVAVTHTLRQDSDLLSQNLAAQRHLAIQSATVFRDRIPGAEASQRQSLVVVSGDLLAHEDFRVIRIGVHKQAEKAHLTEFAEAAISWSHDSAVQVVMDHVVAQTRVTAEGLEEFFSFEAIGSPKMRVIKTASLADALPGEVVEFTLRFDNVGHQAIGNVTIIDNLTTRLEYIKRTDQCSVDAEFSVDNNDAESLTLRWEITQPLNTGEGGIIRFKCRVR